MTFSIGRSASGQLRKAAEVKKGGRLSAADPPTRRCPPQRARLFIGGHPPSAAQAGRPHGYTGILDGRGAPRLGPRRRGSVTLTGPCSLTAK